MAAAGTEFGGGMRGGPLEQGGVPGGADGQVDGKDRAVEGHVAVRDLLDEQGGDAQAAAIQDVALDQVGEVGAVVGPGSVAVVDAGPGVGAHQTVEGAEAREALGLGVQGVGEFEVSVPGTAVGVPAVHPLVELADLLAPGHAGQKVGDAGVEGGGRVEVRGLRGGGGRGDRPVLRGHGSSLSAGGGPGGRRGFVGDGLCRGVGFVGGWVLSVWESGRVGVRVWSRSSPRSS